MSRAEGARRLARIAITARLWITADRLRCVSLALLIAGAGAAAAWSAPLARVEGLEDAGLAAALRQSLGEADTPEDRWRAREQ
ncbi:MAG: hypothetical protein ACOC20_07875, partial [Oceanicaulis sp.]